MSLEELFHVVRVLVVQLSAQEPGCMDYESRRLLQYCGCQIQLLQTYAKIQALQRARGSEGEKEGGEQGEAVEEEGKDEKETQETTTSTHSYKVGT